MNYSIDFQKEYVVSEQVTETIFVIVVNNEDYKNHPLVFTKIVHPSSYIDVKGVVEEWHCGEYSTREFQAVVSLDDVINAFISGDAVCRAYHSYAECVAEVYFNHD